MLIRPPGSKFAPDLCSNQPQFQLTHLFSSKRRKFALRYRQTVKEKRVAVVRNLEVENSLTKGAALSVRA